MVAAPDARRRRPGPPIPAVRPDPEDRPSPDMLCCGRKKEGREQSAEMAASPRRQGSSTASSTPGPGPGPGPGSAPSAAAPPSSQQPHPMAGTRPREPPSMVVQSDFRKVSGISTEIFRQLETIENDHDATTAAALDAVERRGDMLVRLLDPRHMGRTASEAARRFLALQDPKHAVHFVEIVKRPGQTLGLYIREGNGIDRGDGVFISRIALESAVYNSGCLRVGDEILAVNLVDVTRMSLDDVVIIMSIPRRLVLTTRQRRGPAGAASPPPPRPEQKPPPVVVMKRGVEEEPLDDTTSTSNGNGDHHFPGPSARYLTGSLPRTGPGGRVTPAAGTGYRFEREAGRFVDRDFRLALDDQGAYDARNASTAQDDQFLYYNSQPYDSSRYRASTLDRPPGGTSSRLPDDRGDLSSISTYQPPPPPSVITEQPKSGVPQHFTPFDRSYPKTLESLAEQVHPFYGIQGMGLGPSGDMSGSRSNLVTGTLDRSKTGGPAWAALHGQGPSPQSTATLGRASTLGRTHQRTPSGQSLTGGTRGGRLLRSGSDQRLPVTEGDLYEYVMSRHNAGRASVKTMQHYPVARQTSADAATRLGVGRRGRTASVDYASDTEATNRSNTGPLFARPSRVVPGYPVVGSESSTLPWGTSAGLTSANNTSQKPGGANDASQSWIPPSLRSNSLPRDRGRASRTTQGVRFDRDPTGQNTTSTSSSHHTDSQEDSDGAVSAPELPTSSSQSEAKNRIPSSPSVFTAAEYKAWMQRAPSTSAIYERLKQNREALQAQQAARFTYSAENLLDRNRDEPPYYAYRSHLSSTTGSTGQIAGMSTLPTPTRSTEPSRDEPSRPGLQPTPARTADPRNKLLEINPAEYMKYRSERPAGSTPTGSANLSSTMGPGPAPGGTEEGVSGLLWIHLLGGRGLRSTSSRNEPVRDLYCVLECDRVHKARTVIRTGDVNFDWDETFDLDLVVNKELDMLIYSWDPQLRHRLCFKGSIQLVPLLREAPVHQIALRVEPRGTLYLKLRYTEPRTAFRRPPTRGRGHTALFGTDLESVVSKEGSGLGVPMLIQRCVEEVERRGMDIVGLYRLCGSATKKRILREGFERNPRSVDLSPDNVPDINVITGLLKEYLRELPEPLFTKCLYQMLVEALAVCLPDDPEGNAKLMFSILECLPKNNRNTLFLLMDHLCLVAAQSDRNKMTPQNLAISFGPVLMLHSDDVSSLDFQKPIGVLKYLLQIWPMKSARAAEAAVATASLSRRPTKESQVPTAQPDSGPEAPKTATTAVTRSNAKTPPSSRQSPQSLVTATVQEGQPQPQHLVRHPPQAPQGAEPRATEESYLSPLADQRGLPGTAVPDPQPLVLPPLPPRPHQIQPSSSCHAPQSRPVPPLPVPRSTKPQCALASSTARGEADGSPAPTSDSAHSLGGTGTGALPLHHHTALPMGDFAGSEDATPASSATPSVTSPDSTSTSPSPQPTVPPLPPRRPINPLLSGGVGGSHYMNGRGSAEGRTRFENPETSSVGGFRGPVLPSRGYSASPYSSAHQAQNRDPKHAYNKEDEEDASESETSPN